MALTNNGTLVSLPDSKLPTGYSAPAVTTFTDHEYVRSLTLTILKVTVDNADKSVTLANIIDDVTIGIEKQVNDLIVADFGANTGQFYTDFTGLSHNISPSANTDFLNDSVVNYIASVVVYAKTD